MVESLGDPLLSFIAEHVDSFAKWDLLAFFDANPEAAETTDRLSRHLSRAEDEIREAAEELASGGVLQKAASQDPVTYRLDTDSEARHAVEDFVRATRSRDIRLQVLAHLLRSGAR